MLPTLVFVALPTDTGATDTEAFLAACNQAYVEGECRVGRQEGASSLGADVRWLSSDDVHVDLKFTLRERTRTLSRNLEFKTEDDVHERLRALGFVVGSLAGTATELVRVEEQAIDTTPIEKPVPTKVDPNDSPPPPSQPQPTPDVPTVRAQSTELRGRLRLGALSGAGWQGLRWGGTLGASAVWNQLWLLDLHGAYSREEGASQEVDANFVELGISVGFESQTGPWALGLNLGPRFVQVQAEQGLQEDSLPPALGGQLAFNLRYVTPSLSPFVELDALLTRRDKVLLDGRELEFEPVQLQVSFGFAFADLVLEQRSPNTSTRQATTQP